MIIEPFEPATASDSELLAVFELEDAVWRERDPESPWRDPFALWLHDLRQQSPFVDTRRWVAWDDTRTALLAFSYLRLDHMGHNEHLAWFDIDVAAQFRRQGVATALLREVVRAARVDGRTVLGASVENEGAGPSFVASFGAEAKLLDRRSRLLVTDVDPALLDAWSADASTRAADYSLLMFEGPLPDDVLQPYLDVEAAMNDAPRDALDMDDWVNTPELKRDAERRRTARGQRWWTLVARHDPTGEFAGFTGIELHPLVSQQAWQGGTAVRSTHRGHAIGRWLKAAMLAHLRNEVAELKYVDTWNAGSNKWMLAINDDLGFKPLIWYQDWQAPVEVWEKALGL